MSHYVSPLDRFIHALLWLLAAIAIPLALVVGIGRELLPLVSEQKPLIERFLHDSTGLTIRLGEVSGHWRGLNPQLEAKQVQIFASVSATKPLLTIPSVSTEPDWWASLRDLSPRLQTRINGLTLTLAAKPGGGVQVLELVSLGQSDPAQAEKALRWLLAQPSLILQDNQLRWQTADHATQVLHDVHIQQFHHGDYHLNVAFRLAANAAWQRALFIVSGDPMQWQKTPWQGYLQLQDLVAWQPWVSLLPEHWNAKLKRGQVKFWLRSPGGLPTALTASLQAAELSVNVPERGLYDINNLSTVIAAQRTDKGWQLGVEDLQGQLNGSALPLHRLAINYTPTRVEIAAARISLTNAAVLLLHERILPNASQRLIEQLQPSGFLPRAQLIATRSTSSAPDKPSVMADWQLQSVNAEFKALTLLKTEHTPGVKDLAGWAQGTTDGGLLYLDTQHAELDLHSVFREPTLITQLRGGVRWIHRDGLWHIDTDVLHLRNPDLDVHAQLALRIPDRHPQDADLDLLASVAHGRVANAYRYVPWTAADDDTLGWLKRALVAGTIESGAFLYSGPIADRGHGRFDMQLQLANATLDYEPGWPALEKLDARVSILGRALEVSATHAQVMSAEASDIKAHIADMQHSILTVDTDLALDLSDLDTLLASAPIKVKTATIARELALKGPAKAHLNLRVPLASGDTDVSVDAMLDKAVIGLPTQGLEFTRVSGPVHFDSHQGLDSSGLDSQLWGRPARIMLAAEHRAKHWWQQRISVDAQADSQAIQRWLNADLSRYLRGLTSVRVSLNLPVAAPGNSELRINSDLKGMRILLPAPFAKAAADTLPLQYRGNLGGGEQLASLQLGDNIHAGLSWMDGHLARTLLRVGLSGLAWTDQPGMSIEARLPVLNVADWQAFLAPTGLPATGAGVVAQLPTLKRLTVDAEQVVVGDYRFAATHASVAHQGAVWDVNIRGLQPSIWPNWPVTEVKTTVSVNNTQLDLSPLTLKQAAASFVGSMSWRPSAGGLSLGNGSTTLKGQLESTDISRVLEQMGQSSFISTQSLLAKGELRWNGRPTDFALSQVSGTLDAKLGQGHLREVSGVNLVTRIFGLINASNILRRLRFDFSDVTKKGINFDQITLQGTLNAGIIKPSSFDLDGPSVSIRGRGMVNLNSQTLDQQLRVGVPISSAIPVVAGFLAGPVVGGALVAADLLLDKQLAKITSVRYRVSGPWDSLKVDDEALESLPIPLLDLNKEGAKDVTKDSAKDAIKESR